MHGRILFYSLYCLFEQDCYNRYTRPPSSRHSLPAREAKADFAISDYGALIPPLAQLVRAQSLYLWGPWFESMRADYNGF